TYSESFLKYARQILRQFSSIENQVSGNYIFAKDTMMMEKMPGLWNGTFHRILDSDAFYRGGEKGYRWIGSGKQEKA
ncbi:hypothetical protein KKG05_09875, partial [bacterium]|nr:hypothetical protein [bacterium]